MSSPDGSHTNRAPGASAVVAWISLAALVSALGLGAAACGREKAHHPNLLLVTIDTLRPDRLGAWGYPLPTSPEIDALAADAVVFENAQAHTSWTLPSIATLMTSLHTSTHGLWNYKTRLHADFTTLAERLQAAGYATAAITCSGPLTREFGIDQGFDEFFDDLIAPPRSHSQVTSEPLTRRAISWIEARSDERRPFFLWVHYFDPHFDYVVHPGLSERFGTANDAERYDGEIAYTDRWVGTLLRAVSGAGLREGTVVVLTADHGEEFGEHDFAGHGFTLYDEVTRVPLAIRAPDLAPRRVRERVAIVDVLPTILELLGQAVPTGLEGQSLVPEMRGETRTGPREVFAELRLFGGFSVDSFTRGPFKLIVEHATGTRRLYDVEHDPAEQHDVAAQHPDRVVELERALVLAQRAAALRPDARRNTFSPDIESVERLRELGYVLDEDDEAPEGDAASAP